METNRVTDLEQQIAHLRWRRLQKERAIKSSLVATKTLKQKDAVLSISIDKPAERSYWTHSVVYDEIERPLVITDEEVHKIQCEEFRTKNMLEKRADHHLTIIAKRKGELSNKFMKGEAEQQLQKDKLSKLSELEREVKGFKKGVVNTPPVITVKTPIPKLFA